MKALGILLAWLVLGAAAPTPGPRPDWDVARTAWKAPAPPFRIIGNVYYVGTAGLASYLIVTPKGLILIDGGLEETAPQIAANIRKLGFRLQDVRYLLINHAHFDHAGGLAALKRMSGARLVASAGDRKELEAGRTSFRPDLPSWPPAKVDVVARDGMRLALGGTTLVAHLTPGHTPGCTSWSTATAERGRRLSVIFVCSLTVANQWLVGGHGYPTAAFDFERSFAKLERMKADVFLSFHAEIFDLQAKRARLEGGDRFAFVDPAELGVKVRKAEAAFREELARQYAERGR